MSDSDSQAAPVFATFVGEINQASAKVLNSKICLASQGRTSRLHLVIQSTGGGIAEGVYLHNFIKALPLPLTAYNLGTISSAAVMAYLAAPQRIATANASFMIHLATTTQQNVGMRTLSAATESLRLDEGRTDKVFRDHLSLPPKQWKRYESDYLWLTAEEALACGLVTEIGEFAPPLGSPIYDFALG